MPNSFLPDAFDAKQDKRNRIFNYIHTKRLTSKPEIAAALDITLPTVTQYISGLMADNLVIENGSLDSTGGRRPVALSCNEKARASVGLSLSLSHASAIVLDLYGNRLAYENLAVSFSDTPAYKSLLQTLIQNALAKASIPAKAILGVKISVPAAVDAAGETILYSHVFPTGLSCRELCADIPFACSFCNDATAAGFAELWDSPFENTAVYLSLSNTVGGAVIMDGKIYPGSSNRSGEFGHISIDRDGPRCRCGQRGCLGCYCAATVLSDNYDGDLDAFFLALQNEDAQALSLWDEYLNYLASGIQILRAAFDCDVIIGGFIGSYIEPYIEDLRLAAAARSPFREDPSFIRPCRYKRLAAGAGAALQLIADFLRTV